MGEQFYLEIGCEEIPAGYIQPALEAMSADMVSYLDENRIRHAEAYITGTPRRLVLAIPEMDEHQESYSVEVMGPPRQVAFDSQGRPTKAAEGFARGQGVDMDAVKIKRTPKGDYLYVVREESGVPTRELLGKMLPDFIARIPFPKSMRWGSLNVTFARPICWITALLGKEVVPFEYGDIKSGNQSFGHRFMSPQWITVEDFDSHRENLRKHFVILDRRERRDLIARVVEETAASVNGRILEDDELLDEVTQILEYPQPVVGQFEEKYLQLPPELLITVIKRHQRYFAVTGSKGDLLPYFVTVANTVPRDVSVVAAGNAKVVRARLEDARFYYEEDQKMRLEDRAEELKRVVFHSKLGTSWEKVERFTALARWLSAHIAPWCAQTVERGALLCKADLVSGMVGEFPELQGIMGSAYARLQGESPEVCKAIYEHYQPTRAGGPIPESLEGCLLSVADKMDTIVGCFGVGLIPSGTADPFALRRQTLGIIRIILEKPFKVSLSGLIEEALPLLKDRLTASGEEVKSNVTHFFEGRLHHYLVSQEGISPDVVDASLAIGMDDMVDAVKRTRSLGAFKARPDFDSLAAAFKRVVNIIRTPERKPVEVGLFREKQEKALHAELSNVEGVVEGCLKASDYDGALEAMAGLKGSIDDFFDSVLIMDANQNVRNNRLALLTKIHDLFGKVGDFRKIQSA